MRLGLVSAFTVSVIASYGVGSAAHAAAVTGDPLADGWAYGGHSLSNGVYVDGSANYGFDAYTATFSIVGGSALDIEDGELSWLAGDTVLGVGGQFEAITAGAAGWGGFTGGGVNSLLPASSGPKLQAKFGTSDATWSTSTVAPGAGNGSSSSSAGGGRVQVRTSGYFQTGTPHPGQTEPWTLDGNSGQLLVLDKDGHVSWGGDSNLAKEVARMIWVWDQTAGHVASWELLLNVSLLDRLAPEAFAGLLPGVGDMAILTVQNGDGAYTNALVNVVPEPATLALAAFGGVAMLLRRTRRA